MPDTIFGTHFPIRVEYAHPEFRARDRLRTTKHPDSSALAVLPPAPIDGSEFTGEQTPGAGEASPVRVGDGPLTVISAAADQMFLDIKPEMQAKMPRYKGDLELINHSAGSLTSRAYHKRWNRKNEILATPRRRPPLQPHGWVAALTDLRVGQSRVGFMSQVSPDGEYVLSTFARPDQSIPSSYFVINFKDYRFLQVFYPTRGILAWYSRATGRRQALPGADDPRYVQTDGVWSPDGKYVVFARAEAKDPTPEGQTLPLQANDQNEVQIQYSLYRVPFNGELGGKAEPIAGASNNGMSNNFPKVSPDGRWIVFVKNRNRQLMRPDSELYIVPFNGGAARRMRCNTSRMNSWHLNNAQAHLATPENPVLRQ